MKIPFLSAYIQDFNGCAAYRRSTNRPWSAWGKFFFGLGWWTTWLIKIVLMPLQIILWGVYALGLGSEWLNKQVAVIIAIPRTRARMKHVTQSK